MDMIGTATYVIEALVIVIARHLPRTEVYYTKHIQCITLQTHVVVSIQTGSSIQEHLERLVHSNLDISFALLISPNPREIWSHQKTALTQKSTISFSESPQK